MGKKISIGQVRKFFGEFADAIPDDLDFDLAQEWADKMQSVMPYVLRTMPNDVLAALNTTNVSLQAVNIAKPLALAIPHYPSTDEPFPLTIATPFTGIDMVRLDGFSDWKKWKFSGKEIILPQTNQFKLVQIGYQPNWEAVKAALAHHGIIPQGQWRRAFKEAYPHHDGKGPIGVADASWVSPHGPVRFPSVYSDGATDFYWTAYDFRVSWRWLVAVQA